MEIAFIISAMCLAVLFWVVWLFGLYRAATDPLLARSERGRWVVIMGIFYVFGVLAYFWSMRAMSKHAKGMAMARQKRQEEHASGQG